MPIFFYKAQDPSGKIIQNTINAESKEFIAADLSKKGLTPITIKPQNQTSQNNGSLPAVEKMTLCRYISTMLKSGLSISESINVLLEESTNPLKRKILSDLNYGLDQGQSISTILSHYPNSFDKFFVTIVRSGEISGTLAQTFSELEQQIRAEYSLKQKVSGALLYPSVVFVAMLGIAILMFFFILPQIGQVFLNLKLPLHPATKLMFQVTLFMGKNKYIILSSAAASVVAIAIFFQTKIGKDLLKRIIAPIPVVKNLVKQIDIARFCRTFSTLLASGVPITEALEISLDSVSYSKNKNLSASIIDDVTSGKTLAYAFKKTMLFPPLLTQMIASGEKSGTLDSTLKDLGGFYEEEVETAVKKTTEIIEPILMLVVGIGVGVMVLSVITPIYSVVSNLQATR